MDAKYKRLGENTFFIFVGKVGSSLIGLIMLPFYTSWLTPDEYGKVDVIYTYASIALGVLTCCLADAMFVYPKNAGESARKKYYSSGLLFVGCITVLCASLIGVWKLIALQSGYTNALISDSYFVLFFMLSMFLQNYTQQFSLSIGKVFVFSMTGVVLTLLTALSALLLIPTWGTNGYLLSLIVSNCLAALFSFITSKSYKYFSLFSFDKTALRQLLAYGMPLVPNGIMWWLVNGLNRPVLEEYLGLSAVGLYAVANKFPNMLTVLCTVFSNAWGISVLEEFGKKDFNIFFNKSFKIIFFILVIIGSFISIFSQLIIRIFASNEFLDAWRLLPILILSIIFSNASGLVGCVFMGERKSKYFFYSSLWGGVTSIILTFVLIRIFGLFGACIAVACSFLCMWVVRMAYAWRFINQFDISYYILMISLYILLSFIVVLNLNIYICIILYSLIFLFFYILNKAHFSSVISIIDNVVRKYRKA